MTADVPRSAESPDENDPPVAAEAPVEPAEDGGPVETDSPAAPGMPAAATPAAADGAAGVARARAGGAAAAGDGPAPVLPGDSRLWRCLGPWRGRPSARQPSTGGERPAAGRDKRHDTGRDAGAGGAGSGRVGAARRAAALWDAARSLPGARRRHAEERAVLEGLLFLSDASLRLGGSLEPYRIIEMVVELARRRLGDGAMLWLRAPEGDVIDLAAADHVDPQAAAFVRARTATRPARLSDDYAPGAVVRTGQPMCVDDLTPTLRRALFPDPQDYVRFRQFGWGPSMTVPLPYGDQVIGALTLSRAQGDRPYTKVEQTIAEDLARRAALALVNARMYRESQDAGQALQRSLLPAHPPVLEGADVAMEYRPGTTGTEVGGDFYDVIPLAGGRVGLAIGDVMGRGLRAAAVMGQLRAALRAYALEEWGPAELLARLDVMVSSLPGLPFATCLYGIYEPARAAPVTGSRDADPAGDGPGPQCARVVLAGAGHPAPLLIPPDDDPHYLEIDPGLPLGVGDPAHFFESTVELPPGSSLVFFTDGLVESRHRPLSDGLDLLRAGMGEQMARRRAAARRAEIDAARQRHPAATTAATTAAPTQERTPGSSGSPGPGAPAPDAAVDRRAGGRDHWTGPERRTGAERRTRERRAPGPGRPPGGIERRRGGDRRRRTRSGFSVRSWSGPDTVELDDSHWPQNASRALLELSLLAADLPPDTDDDTALLVLTTQAAGPPLLELVMPPVAASAAQARNAVRAVVGARALGRADDAALLVSEICTNAIKHARSELTLRVWAEPARLRISVEDREGTTLPKPGRAARGDPEAESGWGLLLVEALADAWGVQTTPGGKRVWFDLDLLRQSPDVDEP
ncbi:MULTISPECIES: SpoIIE family protein phosphatase [unclassified Pseudofrankia]|uniref:ATP-binding SpoIIE family protein phosphatase n=1 Tax=unclassified Pseudofrankia TaxID=2994372 RepID=UPI000AFB49F0|nr:MULTISPECIES: SpoIIE family protein phosphatase [unclassified Pseudofrankia]MDT3440505.1 SpoIIE family protein phosphatase [Pseudofrankia sp. BMG5.37]